MDTFMTVRVYCDNRDTGEKALTAAEEEIRRLEQRFSVTDASSEVALINHSQKTTVTVSEDLAVVLTEAFRVARETDGALDITVYPVLKAWGFTTGSYRIPEQAELEMLLQRVDYRRLQWENGQLTLPEGVEIDFGALVKGYTGDRICGLFRERGITSAIVNLGGNVQTIGTRLDGTMWQVGIQDPLDEEALLATVSVADRAVVTSGNYERYFVGKDGNRYWHILDPYTGYPARGLLSVTVIGSSGLTCDACSTALFVMGKEKALTYCRNHPELEAVLVDEDGNVFVTEEIAESLSWNGDRNMKIIKRTENQ